MIAISINLIGFFSAIYGIYVGYLISYRIYGYIRLTIRKPQDRIKKRLDSVLGVNEMLLERYNLGIAHLHESIPLFENKYSVNDSNKICDFFYKVEELGIQYIYLKPKEDSQILYDAVCIGERKVVKSHVFLEEYKP
ncbi:hypothetical protein [Comamonas sp.]|uniref:hypothetical protein n=1 Tax=Comamonas sp. TaxID=34028 RepID=UPI0012D0E117|nr:hypothetical protein [Comamonas sp.]MPS92902.1 hypothetical protein [Comamonas sp.]